MDGLFCTFDGGDDPTQVKLFAFIGYLSSHLSYYRMESTQTLYLVVLKVGLASHYIYWSSYLNQVPSPVASSPLPSSCLFLTARMRQAFLLDMQIVSAKNMQRSAALVRCHTPLSDMNFGQLGMMGSSVLYSSGDDGVAGGNGLCINSQGLSTFSLSNFAYFDWVF